MKQFIKPFQKVVIIDKADSPRSGNYEIVKLDHTNKNPTTPEASPYSVINPEKIAGRFLHYNENQAGFQRSKESAKKLAEIIAAAVNKTETQRRVEDLAPELLDLIITIHFDNALSKCSDFKLSIIKKRISAILNRVPTDFEKQIEN